MSVRIHNKCIASGLAVSAFVAAHQDEARATELDRFVNADSIQAFDIPRIPTEAGVANTSDERSSVVIRPPAESVWEESSQLRFEELVDKIALGGALSPGDQLEYRKLKNLRQQTHPSRSFDQIVADHELHKKVAEAVSSLKVLIEYATSSFPTEAQTSRCRIKAIRQDKIP